MVVVVGLNLSFPAATKLSSTGLNNACYIKARYVCCTSTKHHFEKGAS